MTFIPPSFGSGFAVGIAVAAPIGPMGLLCIQRTLATGMRAGLATGLGASTVHGLYGAAAVLGLVATLKASVEAGAWALQLASAGLLAFFAVRLLTRRAGQGTAEGPATGRLSTHYRSAVAVGLTNPLTFLLLLAAVPALAEQGDGYTALAGLVCGSAAWWVTLTSVVSLVRGRVGIRMMRGINVACAACLLFLAVGTVRTALGPAQGTAHAATTERVAAAGE